MQRHALKITADGVGGDITLDGTDIGFAVHGATLKFKAGHVPVAELDMIVFHSDADITTAKITIPDKTRTALIALGWTPPAEQVITDDEPMRA